MPGRVVPTDEQRVAANGCYAPASVCVRKRSRRDWYSPRSLGCAQYNGHARVKPTTRAWPSHERRECSRWTTNAGSASTAGITTSSPSAGSRSTAGTTSPRPSSCASGNRCACPGGNDAWPKSCGTAYRFRRRSAAITERSDGATARENVSHRARGGDGGDDGVKNTRFACFSALSWALLLLFGLQYRKGWNEYPRSSILI
jgi:hypothetical protein